ncbi:glycosyltransferase family 4 protein [Providencia sp. PROV174]|uniref:glycosyltransferase family 4 protein n=1 Tax=Providencia sp. PROV174 TaxID=2949877 RepID=UPI00234AD18A|nr:glycosyltransferase family 4 protein [Providencia sp. PROV174]
MSYSICILIPSLNNTGPVKVAFELAKNYKSRGNSVFIFALKSGTLYSDFAYFSDKVHSPCRKKNIFLSLFDLIKFLKNNNIEVIHSHCLIPDFLALFFSKKYSCITTCHNYPNIDYLHEYGKFKGSFLSKAHFFIFSKLKNTISCSESVRENLKSFKVSSVTIKNGVCIDHNHSLYNKNKNKNKIFVFVGRLIERKQPIQAYQLFCKIASKGDQLFYYGEGPLLGDLKKLTIKDSRVSIKGFVDDIQSIYLNADILISLSLAEGYPLSVLEAISYKCKVVLSGIAPHLEIQKSLNEEIVILCNDNHLKNKIYTSLEVDDNIYHSISSELMTDIYLKYIKNIIR